MKKPSIKECIDELLEAGYCLDDELIEEALRKAGEIRYFITEDVRQEKSILELICPQDTE